MFVLCRTSNGGAKDFEYEKLADGRHVYDLVGDKLNALGKDYMGEHGYSSIGLVIGGTHIEEATEIRAKYQTASSSSPATAHRAARPRTSPSICRRATAAWSTPAAASCWPTRSSRAQPSTRPLTTSV